VSRPAVVLLATASVVVLLVLLPTMLGWPGQVVRHAVCVRGAEEASGTFWTPIIIVDSPPSFNNSTTFATASGWAPGESPAYLNISDGEAAGVFSLDSWGLFYEDTHWLLGPGNGSSCQSLVAVDLSREHVTSGPYPMENVSVMLPAGSLSDVGVPHTINMTGPHGTSYSSVYFVANYSDGFPGYSFSHITMLNSLGGSGGYQAFSESDVGSTFYVKVQFADGQGNDASVAGYLAGVDSTVYYTWAPWLGCIQWSGNTPNPFGTGLAFGPPHHTGFRCDPL